MVDGKIDSSTLNASSVTKVSPSHISRIHKKTKRTEVVRVNYYSAFPTAEDDRLYEAYYENLKRKIGVIYSSFPRKFYFRALVRAAVLIQTVYRGYRCRKMYKKMKKTIIEKKQQSAVSLEQTFHRVLAMIPSGGGKLHADTQLDTRSSSSGFISKALSKLSFTKTSGVSLPIETTSRIRRDDRPVILLTGGIGGITDAHSETHLLVYDPQLRKWSSAGIMKEPRVYHSTVLYQGYVLIIGGSNPNIRDKNGALMPTKTTFQFSFRSGHWYRLADMCSARCNHSTVVLDDVVYILGGKDDQGCVLQTAEKYDAKANRWHTITPLLEPVMGAAIAVNEGLIWLIGGISNMTNCLGKPRKTPVLSKVRCFDPVLGQWYRRPDLPEPRAFCSAVTLRHEIYVFGGFTSTADGKSLKAVSSVFIINSKSDVRKVKLPNECRSYALAITKLGSHVHLIGGTERPSEVNTAKHFAFSHEFEGIKDETALPWPITGSVALTIPPDYTKKIKTQIFGKITTQSAREAAARIVQKHFRHKLQIRAQTGDRSFRRGKRASERGKDHFTDRDAKQTSFKDHCEIKGSKGLTYLGMRKPSSTGSERSRESPEPHGLHKIEKQPANRQGVLKELSVDASSDLESLRGAHRAKKHVNFHDSDVSSSKSKSDEAITVREGILVEAEEILEEHGDSSKLVRKEESFHCDESSLKMEKDTSTQQTLLRILRKKAEEGDALTNEEFQRIGRKFCHEHPISIDDQKKRDSKSEDIQRPLPLTIPSWPPPVNIASSSDILSANKLNSHLLVKRYTCMDFGDAGFQPLCPQVDPNLGMMVTLQGHYRRAKMVLGLRSINTPPPFTYTIKKTENLQDCFFPVILTLGGLDPREPLKHSIGRCMLRYLPLKDTWQYLGMMPAPRCFHSAVKVGSKIYVIGGFNPENYRFGELIASQSTYVFDVSTSQWTELENMVSARAYHSAIEYKGLVYVFGGRDDMGRILNTVEVYTPESNVWRICSKMPSPRMGAAATVCCDKVWVIGGVTTCPDEMNEPILDEVICFSLETMIWTRKSPLPHPRAFARAQTVNSEVYVCGGCASSLQEKNHLVSLSSIISYDASGGDWRIRARMDRARHCAATAVIGDCIYAIGGMCSQLWSPLARNELCHITENCHLFPKPLPLALTGMAAIVVPPIDSKFSVLNTTKKSIGHFILDALGYRHNACHSLSSQAIPVKSSMADTASPLQ